MIILCVDGNNDRTKIWYAAWENDTICDFLGGEKNAIDAEADVLQ